MRGRRTALLVAASLLLVSSMSWAEPQLAVEIDSAQTGPVTLRYLYEAGTADTYRMTMQQQMSMSGMGMGDATTIVTMNIDNTQAVQSIDEAGNATIFQTLSNSSIAMTVNGQAIPADDLGGMLNGINVTMQVTPRGTVLDSQLGDVSDPQLQQMMDMMGDSFTQMTLEFPEEELQIGQSWTQELPFDMDQPGLDLDTSATATYTLSGFGDLNGTNVAVLQNQSTIAISGTFEEMGTTTTANGTGTGVGYTYFDPVAGKIVSGSMEMSLDMTIAGEGMTLNQNMTMTMEISRL